MKTIHDKIILLERKRKRAQVQYMGAFAMVVIGIIFTFGIIVGVAQTLLLAYLEGRATFGLFVLALYGFYNLFQLLLAFIKKQSLIAKNNEDTAWH